MRVSRSVRLLPAQEQLPLQKRVEWFPRPLRWQWMRLEKRESIVSETPRMTCLTGVILATVRISLCETHVERRG